MLIKSRWSLVVIGILWNTMLLVFAPAWHNLQVLLALSFSAVIGLGKVLTRPCPHCGKPVRRAQHRCPACKRRPHEERNTP
jgi:predicted amidophosphoribosyltransferase